VLAVATLFLRVKSLSRRGEMCRVENFCSAGGETGRGNGGRRREGKMERREGMCTRSYCMVGDARE
jgi:hypothetical protein